MNQDAIVALGVAGVAAVILADRWSTVWAAQFDEPPIPQRPPFADFIASTPHLDDSQKTSDASDVLLDRQTKLYDELNDATKGHEAKATTILGFVGGGASIYALVSEAKPGSHPQATVMLALCALLFVGSLLACLLCLVGRRRRGFPEIRTQLGKGAVLDAMTTTKARVSAYLLLLLIDRSESYRRVNILKSYYMELAQQLFAIAVFTLVLNFVMTSFAAPAAPASSTLHCATGSAKILNANTLDCTTTGETHGT